MGSQLQQVLRSLCFNTGWKYAVFWKLKHRARMMFTLEDAYYDSNQEPDKNLLNEKVGNSNGVPYSHDPLGLAVAKMSYQVYSLGEGIIGQTAVSGKHSWIFSDERSTDTSSTSECFGGWENQFSAGIKTIAVVSVIPHGIVQLGSLHKIAEDLKLVDHIRNIFSKLQDSSSIPSYSENSCQSDTRTRISNAAGFHYMVKSDISFHEVETNLRSQYVNHSDIFPPFPVNEISLPSSSESILTRRQRKLPEITKMPSTLPLEILDSADFRVEDQFHLSPFNFSAGYELYEALGPSFHNQNNSLREAEKTFSDMAMEISEEMCSSNLLKESSDLHLLDAVVAKVMKTPPLSAETTSVDTTISSFDRATSSSLTYGVESLKGFSSASSSRGSELLERSREPVKVHKKRARPGESCKPRPRDRQLIQDRIKELRELVPNGSKCSIDSLLERTIKHMLFMQSITKHAEKLHKCSASKLLDKDTGMRRFSCHEQGSSWAVEVGNSNPKVCPILVENINMNGQMLVEMFLEECNQFLDIAETIRSLGLTILKGVSELYGNKTWICFVVENDRNMHRMDVLWSLMQLLQSKIAN